MAKKLKYSIRAITGTPGLYSVTKLDDEGMPLETYETSIVKKVWPPCSCPSRRVPCKHIKMVKRLVNEQPNGSPNFGIFDSALDKFEITTQPENGD